MNIFSVASQIYQIYRISSTISGLFMSQTATIIDKIGNSDFNAATKCLRDAERSNNPKMELWSAITLLKSSIEKVSSANKTKTQCTILIAVCYKVIGEDSNSSYYQELAKKFFSDWIDENRPIGIPSISKMRMGTRNYIRYSDFKEDIESWGIRWNGYPSFMAINPFVMNEAIMKGCEDAKISFCKKIDHIFDLQICRFKCNHCNTVNEFKEIQDVKDETDVTFVNQFVLCRVFNYKLLQCVNCGARVIIDKNNNIVHAQ